MKALLRATAFLLAAAASAAQTPFVDGGPDRTDPLSYGVGDAVVWTFHARALPPSAQGRRIG